MIRTALSSATLAGGLAVLALSAPAGAQGEFEVTAQQLKVNQRISAAAVRRANEALTRLGTLESAPRPAMEVTFFAPVERDGTMAGPIPTPYDPVDDTPGASAPAPIQPAPREASPAPVGIAGVDLATPGRFNVRLTRPAWTCGVQATLTDPFGGQVAAFPPQGATVHVVTRNAQGLEAPRAFHLTVFCPAG